jgi:glutamate synthase (NADPH/NADH) small chain
VVGSEFTLEVDTVVIAIGYSADPLVAETTPRLNVDRYGLFVVDPESGLTSRRAIYAGGDAVRGADYVVNAIADGRRAAAAIHDYLSSLRLCLSERR